MLIITSLFKCFLSDYWSWSNQNLHKGCALPGLSFNTAISIVCSLDPGSLFTFLHNFWLCWFMGLTMNPYWLCYFRSRCMILSSWLLKCHSLVSCNGFTLPYLYKKIGVFRFWEIEISATIRSLRHWDLSSWGTETFGQGQGHKTLNNFEELILL